MSQLTRTDEPSVLIAAQVPESQREGLRDLARREYTSVSTIVRRAVARELERADGEKEEA